MKKLLLLAFLMLTLPIGDAWRLSSKVTNTVVYMFGFSANFNDSTVYFTNVQEINPAYLESKTKFLVGRHDFSEQLYYYVQSLGVTSPTCMVSFGKDRKSAESKYQKLIKRYKGKKKHPSPFIIKYISDSDFKFTPVGEPEEEKPLTKEEKKALKLKQKEQEKKMKAMKNGQKNGMPCPPPGGGMGDPGGGMGAPGGGMPPSM